MLYIVSAAVSLLATVSSSLSTSAQSAPVQQEPSTCTVNLAVTGQMEDVLSNTLMHACSLDGDLVRDYLTQARVDCVDGPSLLKKSAAHFGLDDTELQGHVERFHHVNCGHPKDPIAELEAIRDPRELDMSPLAEVASQEHSTCTVNLQLVGQMDDVLSNVLMHAYSLDGVSVQGYLKEARLDCVDGPALLRKSAAQFDLDQSDLRGHVERFRHVNCEHSKAPIAELEAIRGPLELDKGPLTEFAADVTTHVVLHEIGHALVREFDLPVLSNEETLADSFATWYLTTHMPERAPAVLEARVASLLFEASEVPRKEWSVDGEHNSDARRANQIAAIAIAADRERYSAVADLVEMSESDRSSAADYGTEIHRSWRRVLRPTWLPDGVASRETRLRSELSEYADSPLQQNLELELKEVLNRFDWHSQVTISFVAGDGGASWSRSKRTVTVNNEYIQRFIAQGKAIGSKQ